MTQKNYSDKANPSSNESNTFHELLPLLRTSAGDGQRELVDSHSVRDRQRVNALVRGLPRQQFP